MRTGIVKQLEHSCALTLDSEARDALVGLLVFLVLQGDSSSPDGSTLRRRTKLARKAERLASEIEADLDFSDFSFRNPVTDLPERLRFFAQLRTPGRRRGRPSRDYNNFAIDKLAVFFHQVGGEVAVGGGPFTKFLKIVWEVLPPDKRCASANTFARRAKDRLPLLRGQLAENLSSIDPIDCSVSRGSTPI
jgi:hypothetical protein